MSKSSSASYWSVPEDAHGDAAGDGALELLAVAHAAAVLLDEGAKGDAEVELVAAGLVDVSGHAHELGAPGGRAADGGAAPLLAEPLPAVLDDAGEVGEGFDVVDDGGLAEEALERGEGRLDAGPAALALKAFEECGFLAADVGACAAVDVALDGPG
jgi:hypothetical protein